MNQLIQDKINQHFSHAKPEHYRKGRIIAMAGQEPPGVAQLVKGLVEQYDITSEGNKLTVNVFKPPAFFPMSWAINRTPNTYFFAALTDVELKLAEPQATVDFLQANPDVLFDLLSRVYIGTDALLRRLVLAASGIAASRLIYELLIEAYRFGVEQPGGSRVLNIKQHVLAARSGLARETVSRELRKLEAEKLVWRSQAGLVLDIKLLEQRLATAV